MRKRERVSDDVCADIGMFWGFCTTISNPAYQPTNQQASNPSFLQVTMD
jgi:hypothetical protein